MLAMIALGGAVGSVARYLLGGVVQRTAGLAFPIGTLAVNVTGSFIAGFLLRYFMNVQTHPTLRAALYVAASVALSLMAVFVGFAAGVVAVPHHSR